MGTKNNKPNNMKTEMYLIEDGIEIFVTDLSAESFDHYAHECEEKCVNHVINGNVLEINGKILLKRI